MKKRAVAAVALTALMVSPVFSAGYVGAKYKYHSMELEEFAFGSVNTYSGESSDWQVDGSYGFLQDGFGAQVEGSFGSHGDSDVWGVSGHVYWPGNGWRLGGLLSIVSALHGAAGGGVHTESQELSIGLAGSIDFTADFVGKLHATIGESETTVSGLGLGGSASSTDDTWYAEAGASYYLSPRFRLDASIGFGMMSVEEESDAFNFAVGGEYQPLDLPLSITARYNRSTNDYPAAAINSETDTFSVGLRLSFGAETIRDRDRTTPYDGHYGATQHSYDF